MPLANTVLVHEDMAAKLLADSNAYPLTIDVKEHDGTEDSVGSPDLSPANFDVVSGLGSLRARLTPITSNERRAPGFTTQSSSHYLLLSAYYPLVTVAMVVVIGSTLYNIEAVEVDGSSTFTRLRLEIVQS